MRAVVIVVAPHAYAFQFADPFKTLGGIGVVADNIPHANIGSDAVLLRILQDRLKGLPIAVDIAQNSIFGVVHVRSGPITASAGSRRSQDRSPS